MGSAHNEAMPKIRRHATFCDVLILSLRITGVGSRKSIISVIMLDIAVAMYKTPASKQDPVWSLKSKARRTGLQWKNMRSEMTAV